MGFGLQTEFEILLPQPPEFLAHAGCLYLFELFPLPVQSEILAGCPGDRCFYVLLYLGSVKTGLTLATTVEGSKRTL